MIDNVTLQVLANHCSAAAEAMGFTLMRTAYSTFVKETEDFSCQLLTRTGQTFASPMTMGATWFTGLDYGPVISMFDDYREGDLYLTNDPYSGFVATHSPDIHLWRPVFSEGQLVCFVGCHIHNTDVGGAVPASLSRDNVEVHQEGVRIPPMRLMRDGVVNGDVLRILGVNVRVPDQNRGDMNAQIACIVAGERKVHELVKRFGVETFTQGVDQLLDYADQQARAVIASIPDGTYFFADYADEDARNGFPVRLCVTLTVEGETTTLDFTGSDPQLRSALNMPTGGNERHALVTVGLIYVLKCIDPSILLNAGTVRSSRAILPPGTVVNCEAPAAVGMRSLMGNLSQAVVIGAFSQAVPHRLPASPGSGVSLVNVKTTDRTGRIVMASIGPVGGGAGGGPSADGAEGSGANMAYLKNTPVEINEAEIPIAIRSYGLVPDSGGPGRWRGGLAAEMEFQLFAPNSVVTARNRDRSVFSAWGVLGGASGAVSSFTRNPGTPQSEELGSQDVVLCEPGDVIRLIGPGAGGYGPAWERPPTDVLNDVRYGFVSRDRARSDYGVVVDASFAINENETAAARQVMRERGFVGHFGHGLGRMTFESVWTVDRYAALTRVLASVPVSWRSFVKHQIFKSIGGSAASGQDGAEAVLTAYESLTARHTELPPLMRLP